MDFRNFLEEIQGTNKAVDNGGNPLKVYHGRWSAELEERPTGELPVGEFPDKPRKSLHYFSPSQKAAGIYGQTEAFYLTIKNPRFIKSVEGGAADLYKDARTSAEKPYDGTISYWNLTGGEEEKRKFLDEGYHIDSQNRVWFELAVESKDQIRRAN